MKSFFKKPVSIGDAISKFLKRSGLEKGVKQRTVLLIWHNTVGEKIAKNSEPVKIEGGNLYVKVKNDSWRYNLGFYTQEIIDKLNAKLGSKVVTKITLF